MTHHLPVSSCAVCYAVHRYEAAHVADAIRVAYAWVCLLSNNMHYKCVSVSLMGWLPLVASLKLYVSFAEYCFLCRSLLHKRHILKEPTIRSHPLYNMDYMCVSVCCSTCVWVGLAYVIHVTYAGRLLRHVRHAYMICTCSVLQCVAVCCGMPIWYALHTHTYVLPITYRRVCVYVHKDMSVCVCNRLTCHNHT